jgi:hypothetical protein
MSGGGLAHLPAKESRAKAYLPRVALVEVRSPVAATTSDRRERADNCMDSNHEGEKSFVI